MKDKTKILPWGRTLNLVLMVNVFSSLCAILDAWLLRGWEELFLPCTGKAEKLMLAFPSFCEDEHLGWAARHSSCVRVWIKRAVPAGVEKEASAMWNLCSYLYTGGIVKRILVTPRTGLHSLFSYPTCGSLSCSKWQSSDFVPSDKQQHEGGRKCFLSAQIKKV